MAGSIAAERLRTDPIPATPRPAQPPRRTSPSPQARRPGGSLRRTTLVCIALVVGSLLSVVGANAYLTQHQVQLTHMQQQLAGELDQYHDLQNKVAHIASPTNVVSQAQRHGLVAPGHVTDLPQVTVAPAAVTTTAPPAPGASARPNGGR